MPTALSVVKRHFPEVTEVVDAGRNMLIEVTKADERIANKQNHKTCAMAVACKRKTEADGVLISVNTAYIIKGTVARRYTLPPSVSREVVSFDRNGGFAPGVYQLSKIGENQKLGVSHPVKNGNGHGGGNERRFYHRTEGIRTALGSAF